jgi:hypothetical protein
MSAEFLFANNASTTLAAPITTSSTTLQVFAGTGSLFPSPTTDQQFAITMLDAATGLINEIMYCTNMTGDTLTVIRAQEGTTAKAWAIGDFVNNYLTAGTAAAFNQGAAFTVYTLPAASGAAYQRAFVTDSTVTASGNFGAIVVGYGSHIVPVWCDGTNWLIG